MTTDNKTTPARMTSTQAWVTYLSKVELPVLANTLRRINELTDNRNSTVNELATVILNDAQLTSQVLRLSNTVFYNQTRTQVSTVSRAITLIGFDAVKSMAISSLIVDALLQRNDRPHLLRCLARAIHAAVQARCLMPKRNESALEEVFIGALLMNIGELAFWSCETDQANELEQRLRLDEAPVPAQKAVLHSTFTEITRGLVEAWSLGPFIRDVVSPGPANSPGTSLVRHSVEMARLSEQGWSGAEMDKVLEQLGKDIDENPATVRDRIKVNASEAARVAVSLGIPQVTALMPGNRKTDDHAKAQAPEMDPELQLQILRDLTHSLAEQPNINEVCELVIEGIHRAIGITGCPVNGRSGRAGSGAAKTQWPRHRGMARPTHHCTGWPGSAGRPVTRERVFHLPAWRKSQFRELRPLARSSAGSDRPTPGRQPPGRPVLCGQRRWRLHAFRAATDGVRTLHPERPVVPDPDGRPIGVIRAHTVWSRAGLDPWERPSATHPPVPD